MLARLFFSLSLIDRRNDRYSPIIHEISDTY